MAVPVNVVFWADASTCVLTQVILQWNEERPIIFDLKIKLLFELISPQRGIIGPVTSPLALGPRISALEQSDQTAIMIEFDDFDE